MLKLTGSCLFGLLIVLFTVSACSGVPITPAQSATPAVVSPESAVASTPAPDARAQTGKRDAQALGGIETVVKRLGMTAGIIRTSSDNALALRTPNGNEKIAVDANTIYVVPGKTSAKLSDIQTGDRVLVNTSSKKDLADFVLVLPATYSTNNLLLGAVQASANNSLTVRTPKEARTLTTSAMTVVVKTDQDIPALGSLADVKQGNAVIVLGEGAPNAYSAQTIVILKENLRGALTPNQKTDPALPRQKPGVPVPTPKSGG